MAKTMNYGGFWIRFLAFSIDAIIVTVISRFLLPATCNEFGACGSFDELKAAVMATYLLCFWIPAGATPGKMICKLRIVDENGNKITPGHAALRLFGYLLSMVAFFIGFIWIGFDDKKQGWHDKIAKTYVIKLD